MKRKNGRSGYGDSIVGRGLCVVRPPSLTVGALIFARRSPTWPRFVEILGKMLLQPPL
ncbi:MAG: hypothetical protein MI923_18810 [Phycisphaerales bacterium]|nr:hypothetical protein [Phycisphaerales bacterium]